jgi:hypothetical protein
LSLDQSHDNEPAEANGDNAEEKLMDLEEPVARDTGSKRQFCPHVKDQAEEPAKERACVTDGARPRAATKQENSHKTLARVVIPA